MSKLNTHEEEMIESSTPSLKLHLIRDYPPKAPVGLVVCHHGIMVNVKFYDPFVKGMNESNIIVYRYDARGHGKSEGKRGFVKSIFEMVEDLKIVVGLAKKENPNLPVFVMGHSMGGLVSALFASKYPNEVNGFVLGAGVLKDNNHIFGDLPLKEDPEKYIPVHEAMKAKEFTPEVTKLLTKIYPNFVSEITISIINSFGEGTEYLKKNMKNFVKPVLILNGNADFLVNQKDAIDFYSELDNKDKSLIIFSEVGHELWNEAKGDMIVWHILDWVQYRLK